MSDNCVRRGLTRDTSHGVRQEFPPPRQRRGNAGRAADRHTGDVFRWDDRLPPDELNAGLGRRLAEAGDLFRETYTDGGLLLAPPALLESPRLIDTARSLASVVEDRVCVRYFKDGQQKGGCIPFAHLDTALSSESFLAQFPPVDLVTNAPVYMRDFSLTRPGYNDSGPGHRVLYRGQQPMVEDSLQAITAFLNETAFATNADRTNVVAAALTVLLRNHWPGAKPALVVTVTKSHAGKDTVILFAAGTARKVSVSYWRTDWALECRVVRALRKDPRTGVLVVENARPGTGWNRVASAFLERLVTDPQPLLVSTGTGGPVRRRKDLVLVVSSNEGLVSEGLLNMALPIHLTETGNVADRVSPNGNPKLENLPAHWERIGAELRGMVERWKAAGRPPDEKVRHFFTDWAHTVGGILQANGFQDFLANYDMRKTADDPERQGLGLLGAARADKGPPPGEWAQLGIEIGVSLREIPEADRDSDKGREPFPTEEEDKSYTIKLQQQLSPFRPPRQPET
jgi:hypothetical protein